MSIRGLIIATLLTALLWSMSATAQTRVLVVEEKSKELRHSASMLTRLPGALEIPDEIELTFATPDQDRSNTNLSLIAQHDRLDSLRVMLCKYIAFRFDPESEPTETSITFRVLSVRETFDLASDELRSPNAIILTTGENHSWERVYDRKTDTSRTSDAEPDLDDFFPVEREPNFDYQRIGTLVNYPEIARRNGIEGMVTVAALIGPEGIVEKTVVVESDNQLLNAAAVRAVILTEFSPAMAEGRPVRVWVRLPVVFKLK